MKKILLALVIIGMFGCKKTENPSNNTPNGHQTTNCIISTATGNVCTSAGIGYDYFIYDKNYNLIYNTIYDSTAGHIEQDSTEKYIYNAQGLLLGLKTSVDTANLFSYNANGIIIGFNNRPYGYTNVICNSKGNITIDSVYESVSGKYILTGIDNFSYDNNGNLITHIAYNGDGILVSQFDYTYDNHTSLLSNLPLGIRLIVSDQFGAIYPTFSNFNNPLTMSTYSPGNGTVITNFSYSYNGEGLPVTETVTSTGSPTYHAIFTYNCH